MSVALRSVGAAAKSFGQDRRWRIDPPASFGHPPRLEWLPICDLLVDPGYQRDLNFPSSRSNTRRIAQAFDWSKFAPVVVAPAGSSKFVVVDGQHRSTAAALCGIAEVPCQIIAADRAAQAAAFKAINGNVVKLSSMQLHYAAIVAGDVDALAIDATCAAAGVSVLRYPKDRQKIARGETMAVVVIGRAIKKFGQDVTARALGAIVGSCDGNVGNLRGPTIYGTAEVLADHPEWGGARLIEAFEQIDLDEMRQAAAAAAARLRGSSVTDQFEARLVEALAGFFAPKKVRRRA